jgi:hypothetical protein
MPQISLEDTIEAGAELETLSLLHVSLNFRPQNISLENCLFHFRFGYRCSFSSRLFISSNYLSAAREL